MSIFTTLFSSGVAKVVDSVSEGLNSLFTSDDERNKAKIIIEKNIQDFKLDMEDKLGAYETEITTRWKSDNEHLITRLVRPLSYMFVLFLFAIMVLFDGNKGEFSITESYIPVIETLLVTMTVALFGSRGAEKTMKYFKKESKGGQQT